MGIRFTFFLLLTLCVVIPLQAQTPIPIGSIVLLTSNTGRQLSASPGQGLNLSSNQSGWEQWQWTESGLISAHGTNVFLRDSPRGFFHGPRAASDGIMLRGLNDKGLVGS